MNTNRVLYVLIAIALAVTAAFLVQSAIDTSKINARAEESLALNTDAARWQALGEYYAKRKANTQFDTQRIRDVDAVRWQALGEYYTLQSANTSFDAQAIREIASERWEALGQAFVNAVSPARQADLARWVGLGKFYNNLKASAPMQFDPQRIRDNDAARWEALGEYYR